MPKHPKQLEAEERLAAAKASAEPAPVDPVTPAPLNPVIPPDSELEILKRRLSTMDGILKAQKREAEAALIAAQEREEKANQALAELQAKAAKVQPTVDQVFTPEMAAEHGTESLSKLMESITALVDKKVAAETAPIRTKLEAHDRDAARRNEMTKAEQKIAYELALSQAVPGYETWAVGSNCDPAFAAWLNGRSPGSRLTRQELLNDAHAHMDAVAVSEMLQEFQKGLKAQPPANPNSRRLPEGSPAADRPPPAGAKMTLDYVKKFRMDLTQGKYRGAKWTEGQAIHRRIAEAFKNGEIAE